MQKKLLLTWTFLMLLCSVAWAQGRKVSGRVLDATGSGLPGVNILVKGTQTGTTTDIEGKYSIEVPAENNTLVYSFAGYATQEVAIDNRTVIDITLVESEVLLNETVVTGVAIERERKELGYSISTVKGAEITKAREVNLVNALAAKVPGVQITSQSGSIGASSRIIIRGAASLNGDNQPLFVIDGVPIFNSNIGSDPGGNRISGSIDTGNRAQDISPDDIAEISVLKGAAASALYGMRAKNGVIMITTKRGKSGKKKNNVEFNSSVRFDAPLRLPDFQNEFGPGQFGKFFWPTNANPQPLLNGWGPRVSEVQGQNFPNWQNVEGPMRIYKNNVRDFYRPAQLYINSLSFGGGDEKGDFRLGINQLNQIGMVPNSKLDRTSISFNGGRKVTDQISARVGVNYIRSTDLGRATQGGNNPNVLSDIVNGLARTIDIKDVKNYLNPDGSQRALSNFTNNPYWVANENVATISVDRIIANGQINYKPVDWIEFTGRVGTDNYTEYRRTINRKGTIGRENGGFLIDLIEARQFNTDFLVSATRDLTEDFNLRVIVGHNLNLQMTRRNSNSAVELTVDGLYNTGNAAVNNPTNSYAETRLLGIYGDVTLGYKKYLFLNLTGRNDWSSALPKENRSFFYPSANLSFVFTDAFEIANDILSYGKLRANVAQVGSSEGPYLTNFRFFPITSVFGQFGTGNQFPFLGQTGFAATAVFPNTKLRPQKQNSFELGAELKFLNGRLGLDLTYYNINTSDQIISILIPASTGFRRRTLNAATVSNKGLEFVLNGSPIRTDDFTWDVVLNFARNVNRVEELYKGAPKDFSLGIESAFNGLEVRAVAGETIGLYGSGWLRDEATGQIVIDPLTGLRRSGGSGQRLGNLYPDFLLGFQNNFSYKNFSLSVLLDWKKGGVVYSNTVENLRSSGLAVETAENRDGTFIDRGVIVNADGTTRPNDVPVETMQQFWSNYTNVQESSVFDASYIKLREIRLSYSVPAKLLEKTPFGAASVGIEGRNLFILHSNTPHIDPETNLFGSASNGLGIEWGGIPSVKSLGANLRLTF
jgi:TonB-linked SusC/RagA family outer membrane protein